MPTTMLNPVYNTDSKKNNDLANVIKSRWSNLKNEIEKCLRMRLKLKNHIK